MSGETLTVSRIAELPTQIGREVIVQGWVHGRRSGGKIVFLLVRDGTGVVQCVVEAVQAEAFRVATDLGHESSVRVAGAVRADPRAPGGVELSVTRLEVVQPVADYPIARKEHGVDFLLRHRHLWLRSPRQCAILRIRDTLIRTIHEWFAARGFVRVDTPILAPGAAEGAATLFPVEYFGQTVYLAQTGQLYLEAAAMALGRVYCFGPTFRAEKSKTRRHLTEFWMLEPEIAWAELDEVLAIAEELVGALVARVLAEHRAELALLGRDPSPLERVKAPFPRITYSEAVELLRSEDTHRRMREEIERDRERLAGMRERLAALEREAETARKGWPQDRLAREIAELREDVAHLGQDLEQRAARLDSAARFQWGDDLGGDEETILSRLFDRPLMITRYPRGVKAFYMKPAPDDPRVVLNVDMLAPEGYGEIIGGSQREDRLEPLLARMREEKLDPAAYEWYLDLRRYGSVPHGGFGLGLERFIAWICGLRHIREAIPFPRMMGRLYP
ncbi:MAG: OB-fold nucleic acid binding domain-containing protein [Kiritimatiellae bacterium]|nr:OB-fold nucleic acid binding domain-containing protein [Kiritimatiellia bacterium]